MILQKAIGIAAILILISPNSFGQLGNLKGKVKKPNTSISGNSNDKEKIPLKGSDESGLFNKIDPNGSVKSHCRTAVDDLNQLQELYNSDKIDYEGLQKLIDHAERTLSNIRKLEPEVDETMFQEKYAPLANRAREDFSALERIKVINKILRKDFLVQSEFPKPAPLQYRISDDVCYCRQKASSNKTVDDYFNITKEYRELSEQLVGYKDEYELKLIAKIDACISNAENYITWVCTENLNNEIIDYAKKNKESEPNAVIKKCNDYLSFFEKFQNDYSVKITDKIISEIDNAKKEINSIKKDSEDYISSGQYQVYLDKKHAEKIASVYVPKAETKMPSLEAGVKKWVMGAKDHFNGFAVGDKVEGIKSVNRTSITTPAGIIEKNNDGTIKWKYYSIWTAFTTTDGKCYLVRVFATYHYEGGGKYSSVPVYGSEYLDEMSCDNVNK